MLNLRILAQHKVLVGSAAAVMAPLAAWGAFSAVSHGAFGRSNLSSATELSFLLMDRKKKLQDPLTFDNYLLAQATENERRVDVPELVTFKCSVESVDVGDMQTFMLNRRDRNDRAVIYLHGGNFLRRPTVNQWHFADVVARRTRAEIFFPMYPLAPVHTAQEAASCIEVLYRQVVEEYGARNVTLMGDGAGGGLCAGFAQSLAERGLEQPSHLILVSPWVDITLANPLVEEFEAHDPILASYGLRKVGKLWSRGVSELDPLVSPVNGDVRMLRNVMVFIGTRELFYPDAKLFYDRVAAAGIHAKLSEGRGLNHDFVLYPLKEAQRAVDEIVNAVTED